MPTLIELSTFQSDSGTLTVFEKLMPGAIRRVFYISGKGFTARTGHRHHKGWNALMCLNGQCQVHVHDGQQERDYVLNSPDTCLIVEPRDWHRVEHISEDALLLVLSNEYYYESDCIFEAYPTAPKQD